MKVVGSFEFVLMLLLVFNYCYGRHKIPINQKVLFSSSVANWFKASSLLLIHPALVKCDNTDFSKIREYFATGASYIPGYGPTDINYPVEWAGYWTSYRLITDKTSLTTFIPWIFGNIQKGESFEFNTSFIKSDEKSNNSIVDRGYTTTSELTAFSKLTPKSTTWEVNNPNVFKISFQQGLDLDIKVSKSAADLTRENGFPSVSYSEFGQISETFTKSQEETTLSIPSIYLFRRVVRLKQVAADQIVGIERIYFYSPDTLDLNPNASSFIKSRLAFERKTA